MISPTKVIINRERSLRMRERKKENVTERVREIMRKEDVGGAKERKTKIRKIKDKGERIRNS